MIEYKGYNIPSTKKEILELNSKIGRDKCIFINTIYYIDTNHMRFPISTGIELEHFKKEETDILVNEYIRVIKIVIDYRIEYEENNNKTLP